MTPTREKRAELWAGYLGVLIRMATVGPRWFPLFVEVSGQSVAAEKGVAQMSKKREPQLHINLAEGLSDKLEAAAYRLSMPKSAVARLAIEAELERMALGEGSIVLCVAAAQEAIEFARLREMDVVFVRVIRDLLRRLKAVGAHRTDAAKEADVSGPAENGGC